MIDLRFTSGDNSKCSQPGKAIVAAPRDETELSGDEYELSHDRPQMGYGVVSCPEFLDGVWRMSR